MRRLSTARVSTMPRRISRRSSAVSEAQSLHGSGSRRMRQRARRARPSAALSPYSGRRVGHAVDGDVAETLAERLAELRPQILDRLLICGRVRGRTTPTLVARPAARTDIARPRTTAADQRASTSSRWYLELDVGSSDVGVDRSLDTHFKGWAKPGPIPPGALAPPAVPPEETLDAISGHFRIFQLRDGHRFSTDDVLTAWYGTSWAPTASRCSISVRESARSG